jgi:hypothetical protein
MADIDDDEKRWSPFGRGQRAGITLRLSAGAQQRIVEALGVRTQTQLLRFEDEAAAVVTVDEAVAVRAVAMCELNATLEHVSVVAGVVAGGVGLGCAEHLAQLGDEDLVVRALRSGGTGPSGDEGVDGVRLGHAGMIEPGNDCYLARPARAPIVLLRTADSRSLR